MNKIKVCTFSLLRSPIEKGAFLATIRELVNLGSLQQVCILNECFCGDFVSEVSIDISYVGCVLDWRDVGRCHLSCEKFFPVDGCEEGVRLDLVDGQAIIRVTLEKTAKQVGCVGTESWQDIDVLLGDTTKDLVSAFIALHGLLLERINATDHFIGQHAKTPPIDCETMTSSLDHLRSKILWSSTESVCHAICRLFNFTETEICQLEMPLRV